MIKDYIVKVVRQAGADPGFPVGRQPIIRMGTMKNGPANKVCEGNVLTGVCLSGGVSVWGCLCRGVSV